MTRVARLGFTSFSIELVRTNHITICCKVTFDALVAGLAAYMAE
ncbi:hypothetical protein OYT13_12445 [Pandoraea sp. XJJ-1]|nr:hypothetical protein [Pandoraea sp. XJJ-1]WAL80707.1 hypothetical protein OYT13_12445 [Pandoraea sp. XJJ-1]